jgi:glycosyltransferase involved in cell wall biosynthesis
VRLLIAAAAARARDGLLVVRVPSEEAFAAVDARLLATALHLGCFGNVTLESLACATPVLAFDCAAAGEFITHNTNGWLAHCDDRQGYIQCALEITKNSSILKQAREYTRSSIEHLGWDEIACQVETIFQRAIELN